MAGAALYTEMAGLQAIDARMQAITANLANQQTPGYAEVQAVTEAAAYTGANAPAGADAVALRPNPALSQGAPAHTGNPMDVALSGDAWLEVQTGSGANASTALTRNGTLAISAAGMLTDSAGNPVLNVSGQPISLPPLTQLQIGTDGTLSGIPTASPGGPPQNFGQIALAATPAGLLTPLSGTLYAPPAGVAVTPSAGGALAQGYLNGSNVNPTTSMVDMIDASRSYQMQTDLMKTQSGADASLNALLADA
jgi:flagellar basal-body rod protein FlgF